MTIERQHIKKIKMKNNGKLGVAQEMLRDNFFFKFMVRLIDKWDKSGLLRIIKVKISPPFGYPWLTEKKRSAPMHSSRIGPNKAHKYVGMTIGQVGTWAQPMKLKAWP